MGRCEKFPVTYSKPGEVRPARNSVGARLQLFACAGIQRVQNRMPRAALLTASKKLLDISSRHLLRIFARA
jgi:hypothetical protein